jgi:hypothetical protein
MRLRKSHPQQQRGLGSAFFDTLYFNFHVSDAFTGLSATDAWHRAEPVMQHIQHLSFESLVKMDHFQKELNSTSQKRSAEPAARGLAPSCGGSLIVCPDPRRDANDVFVEHGDSERCVPVRRTVNHSLLDERTAERSDVLNRLAQRSGDVSGTMSALSAMANM